MNYCAHPAWRFILALKSTGILPELYHLPTHGGKETWNEISGFLADYLASDRNNPEHIAIYKDAKDAIDIYNTLTIRVYYEAYLLAGGSIGDFGASLGMCPRVEALYSEAFFDMDTLMTPIQKAVYLENLDIGIEKKIKTLWTYGPERIIEISQYHTGRMENKSPNEILNSALKDANRERVQSVTPGGKLDWSLAVAKIGSKLINNDLDIEKGMSELSMALSFNESSIPVFNEKDIAGQEDEDENGQEEQSS